MKNRIYQAALDRLDAHGTPVVDVACCLPVGGSHLGGA